MIDFKGTPMGANVPGDRTHEFRLPLDRSTVPPKTMTALEAVQAAAKAVGEARSTKAQQAANDALRDAVGDVYDRASSTSRADREHHQEGYAYAAAKFSRAMGEAEAALQLLADHAQQYDNPVGVGFNADHRDNSSAVVQLHVIADALKSVPAVPELDAA